MRLFILSSILTLYLVNLGGQCVITVSTRPTPPIVECSCDVPDIPAEFIEIPANNATDIAVFESLGYTVSSSGPCGELYVKATDTESHPTSCADSFYTLRRYDIGSPFGGSNSTVTRYDTFFTEIIPPHFLVQPINDTITCMEDVDKIFQDYLDNYSYSEYLECYPQTMIEYSPQTPVLATDCGGRQFVRPGLSLTGPCTAKCGLDVERARTASNFRVLDDFKTQISCPPVPPIDVSNPDIETIIADAIASYNLSYECDEPIVSNDFVQDSLSNRIFDCDPEDLVIIVSAMAGCIDNSSSCNFIIDLENSTPPVITDVPDTLFLECGDPLNLDKVNNWLDRTKAIDYLGNTVTTISNNFNFATLSTAYCNTEFSITFTAIDRCDRTDTRTGRIVINDTQDPVIITCPADNTVNADDPALVTSVNDWLNQFSASDVCNPDFVSSNNFDQNLLAFNCGMIDTVVIFSADDNCIETNISTCEASLTILDNVTDQFFNFPSDTTIQCENPINIPAINAWANSTTAGNTLGTTFSVDNNLDFMDMRLLQCNEVIDVEFRFVNQCGVENIRVARLSITDDILPTITCPANITINDQNGEVDLAVTAWLGTALPQDNCSATAGNAYDSFQFSDCTRDTITNPIVFWAQDGCGNRSAMNCQADLTLVTQKEPSITCPSPIVLECGSGNMMDTIQSWVASSLGTNFLGDDIGTTNDLVLATLDTVSCMTETLVTFIVEDLSCDRQQDCSSMITIRDSYTPTIVCPPTLIVASNSPSIDADIQAWVETSTYEDNNCDTPNFFVDYDANVDFCTTTQPINVIFKVVDKCGNESSCVGLINVNNDRPELNCPSSNLTLECGDSDNNTLIDAWLNEATSTDNYSSDLSSQITNNYDNTLLTDTCSMSINIEYSIEDNCGALSSCIGIISLMDTKAPEVDCASIDPLLLLAGDTVKLPKFLNWLDLIPSTDCNEVVITENFDDNLLEGFDCNPEDYDLELTFTDQCGWITNCQASISVRNDIQTTFINCNPAMNNFTAECGSPTFEDDIKQWMALVTAEDNLGSSFATSPDLNFNDPRLFECGTTVPIQFELVDLCGNSQACGLTLTIDDTTRPVAVCPPDTSFVQEDPDFTVLVADWLASVAGIDDCSTLVQEQSDYSPITLPDCVPSQELDVLFTLLDGCGNTENCTSTLTVTTSKVPNISCPSNQIVECGDPDAITNINQWLDQVSGVDADNNPLVPQYTFDVSEVLEIECDGQFPILFTITDNCSIEDTCSAAIIIQDTTAPSALCPPMVTINSTDPDGPQKMQDWIDSYSPTDNCSMAMSTIQNGVIVPNILCNADEEMSVEFYAEDACGLRDTCESIITINKTAPVIACSGDLNLQCGETGNDDKILEWLNTFSGTDNNNTVQDIDNDFSTVNFTNDCESSTEIMFTLTDDCGVPSSCSRLITQKDTLAPVIVTCPSDIVIDIDDLARDALINDWLGSFAAEDVCNNATTEDDYNLQLGVFDCGQDTVVTFLAIDDCGNTNTDCKATISFENNLEVFITCPEPVRLKCNEPSTMGELEDFLLDVLVDSKDEFEVTYDLDLEAVDIECSAPYTQEIVFTITDNCGNTNDCTTSVEFIPSASIYVPTIFRPGSIGENAYFGVKTNVGIENITSLEIYSRWGDLMYDIENFDPNVEEGWDGRNKFGNHVQGVYTYVLIYDDIFGNSFEQIGTITLLD